MMDTSNVSTATPSTKTKSINALRSPIGTISEQLQGQICFSLFINNNNLFLAHAHSFSTWYMNNNILISSQDSTSRSADNATKSSESSEGNKEESKSGTYVGRYPYVAYIYLDEDDMVWTFFGTVTLGGYESYNNEPQENYRIVSIVRHPEYSGWTGRCL